jgi:ribosomal protein L21
MLATADITALGRPILKRARVYVSVEEMTLSEKVIVFKKKRR